MSVASGTTHIFMNFLRKATPSMSQIALMDCAPRSSDFRHDLLAGLSQSPKTLPCKYLYDERGSQLFELICELEEYYPTRAEISILQNYGAEIADALGSDCAVIEYGSGSGLKTEILLEHLHAPNVYFPVDISREHLCSSAAALEEKCPDIDIVPVCADFTRDFELPDSLVNGSRRAAYFSGSTIGNFEVGESIEILQGMARLCGRDGCLLIGVDLQKDPAVLEAAYDDSEGVTRQFNQNLLHRANAELDADFDVEQFQHRAIYNPQHARIEMHLESSCDQQVTVAGQKINFAAGETIHTENSHKHTLESFANIAARAGWQVKTVWTDDRQYFSVQYLTVTT